VSTGEPLSKDWDFGSPTSDSTIVAKVLRPHPWPPIDDLGQPEETPRTHRGPVRDGRNGPHGRCFHLFVGATRREHPRPEIEYEQVSLNAVWVRIIGFEVSYGRRKGANERTQGGMTRPNQGRSDCGCKGCHTFNFKISETCPT
jgi:hypothetical protein